MKKSKAVPATFLVALAGIVGAGAVGTGCARTNDCVDAYGNLLPDEACRSYTGGGHWIRHIDSGGFGGSGGFYGG